MKRESVLLPLYDSWGNGGNITVCNLSKYWQESLRFHETQLMYQPKTFAHSI